MELAKRSNKNIDYNKIIEKNQPFEDPDFPAEKNSLFDPAETRLTQKQTEKWTNYTWERPDVIFEGEPYALFEGVDPNDIKQGALGNCYFLSALSAIAEFPERIKKIFINQEINAAGCYAFRMCLNGEFKEVVIDDRFPFSKKNRRTAFSQTSQKEIWVQLLEKVWAKVNGCYENTITGFTSEAFRCLLGAPVMFYNHELMSADEVWNLIRDSDSKDYVICASAGRAHVTREEFDSIGLVSDHAYTIIWAGEIKLGHGKVERLLKIRNPWGFLEWKGDWSDQSHLWTDEIKREVKFSDKDDGVFHMNLRDYLLYYRSTTICRYNDGFYHKSVRASRVNTRNWALFMIKLPVKSRAYFTCSQFRIRMMVHQEYSVSFVKIILAKYNPNDKRFPMEFIEGKCGKDEDVTLDCENELEPGDYVAFVEIDWNNALVDSFAFSAYTASQETQVQEITDKGLLNNVDFLNQTLASCARKKTKKKDYKEKGEEQIFKCLSITDSNAEYGYVYYENNSPNDATLNEVCIFTKLENYAFLPPYDKCSNRLEIKVGPGQSKIAVMKRTDRASSYSCSYFNTIVYSDKRLLDQIEVKGKKSQIKYQGHLLPLYYYILAHGGGYLWFFKNETKDIFFEATFKFELKNLHIQNDDQLIVTRDSEKESTWTVSLKPGMSCSRKLVVTDPTDGWSYKYSYTYKCVELIESDQELIDKVKAKGQCKQFQYQGEKTEMYYWTLFFNEFYYWVFENNENDKKLEAKFEFDLQNLVVDADEHAKGWDLQLNPHEVSLKKLRRVDMNAECKYKTKYAYSVSPILPTHRA